MAALASIAWVVLILIHMGAFSAYVCVCHYGKVVVFAERSACKPRAHVHTVICVFCFLPNLTPTNY